MLKTLTSCRTLDFPYYSCGKLWIGVSLFHVDLVSPLQLNMKNGISACIQLYYKPVAMITRWKWTCLEILKLEGVLYQNVNTIIYCLQYTLRNLVKALMTFYDCLSCPYYSKCLCLKITVLFHEIILHQCRLLGRYEFKI